MKKLLLGALLFAGGCTCMCNKPPAGITHVGTPPAGADMVVAKAIQFAPCQPRWGVGGTITWRPEGCYCALPGSTDTRYTHANGCMLGTCKMDLCVAPISPDATKTAEAHEFGEYFSQVCGKRWTQTEIEVWAQAVNKAAAAALATP